VNVHYVSAKMVKKGMQPPVFPYSPNLPKIDATPSIYQRLYFFSVIFNPWNMEDTSRNCIMVGRSALAEFIQKLMPSKVHWYAIIQPVSEEPNSSLIHSVFPAMPDSLSLDDEVWRTMLVHLGLATYWQGKICTPLMASRERFIGKYQLKVEVTQFKIGTRKRLFLRIGSWNQKRHPVKRPADIWSKAIQNGFYDTPKLRISSLSMRFALAIAELKFDVRGHQECSNDIIFAD
jgi:hypothetical protein